ncbi:MAG: FHA domain-containing serine/threonine-protein kinase [Planctomycetota bacterium]
MSATLRLEVVGGEGSRALPQEGRLIVGSDATRANLVLAGQGIAAVHCAIGRLKGGGWALKDLGSEYGTILNGERVASARLQHGDTITLGSRRLRVVDPQQVRAEEVGERGPSPSSPSSPSSPTPATSATSPTSPTSPLGAQATPREGLGVVAGDAPHARTQRSPDTAGGTPTIRGFAIERLLGRGGMGRVYLATQESLARKVALKVLAAELEADEAFVERFQTEARTAAALAHTNVVTVHDVGECDGHHYLSMEFMAAGCLESRLQALGPIPWREALGILLDAARGLEYAESRGIVHGDVKPANLMQTEQGATKIADLGLAVQAEREGVVEEGRKLFGTPHFLAPELVRGGRPDARSDLYSLGATAYRILSGHTPHEGDSTREILRRALHAEPQPLHEAVPGLPEGVSHMVARLLSKDPGQRYPSAAVLVAELERLRAADGALPAAPRSRSRAVPLVVGIAAVILAALGLRVMLRGGDPVPVPVLGPGAGDGGPSTVAAGDQHGGELDPLTTAPLGDPSAAGADDGGSGNAAVADTADTGDTADTADGRDERDERLLELQAKNARFELEDRTLTDAARAAELRALSQRFLGTDAGRLAFEDAEALETRMTRETQVETARTRERSAMLAALRAALPLDFNLPDAEPSDADPLDSEPPRSAEHLRALRAVPGQAAWEADAEFVLARAALRDQILDRARDWSEAQWARGEQFEEAGNFEGLLEICDALESFADLPDFPAGDPPQAVRVQQLARAARDKRNGLAALRASFLARHTRLDRETLARGLGGVQGLEAELGRLDFAAARERLERTRDSLSTQASKASIGPLLLEVQRAQAALLALATTWDAGEWKRRAVLDPRTGRGGRSTVGVDSRGLLLSGEDTPDHVPWSAWGTNLRALNNLFNARLRRDWSAQESQEIAALMHLTAVVQTVQLAAQMLDPERRARFSESEAAELVEILEDARSWALRAGDDSRVGLDLDAVGPLARALRAATEEGWSDAVSAVERLLGEHDSSLLVWLLSDGSVWRVSTPEPDPGQGPEFEPGPGSAEQPGGDQGAAGGAAADDPPAGEKAADDSPAGEK